MRAKTLMLKNIGVFFMSSNIRSNSIFIHNEPLTYANTAVIKLIDNEN